MSSIDTERNVSNRIPVWEKMNLTIEEAAEYSGIGDKKIRELVRNPRCPFVCKRTIASTCSYASFSAIIVSHDTESKKLST